MQKSVSNIANTDSKDESTKSGKLSYLRWTLIFNSSLNSELIYLYRSLQDGSWNGQTIWKVRKLLRRERDVMTSEKKWKEKVMFNFIYIGKLSISGYQKRWFVLSNGVLSYYRNQTEIAHCRGTISLHGALIRKNSTSNFPQYMPCPWKPNQSIDEYFMIHRRDWFLHFCY